MAKSRGICIDTGTFRNQLTDSRFPTYYVDKLQKIRAKYEPGAKFQFYENVQEMQWQWSLQKRKMKCLSRYKHFAVFDMGGGIREAFRYVDLELMEVTRI